MLIYRIKQFYWSLTSKVDDNDIKYIKNYLNEYELKLFLKLKQSEQKHCINVAKDVEKICFDKSIKYDRLIKVGLLHDIGKSVNSLNIIDKAIIVILDKLTKGYIRKFDKLKKVYSYYNHGKIGAKLLSAQSYDEKFLYLIENHHNKDIENDMELDIIRNCDNRH